MSVNIVLGVTGSIAAYKAAELVRLMTARKWDVSVLMTEAATQFVGELTFRTLSRNPVGIKMFGSGGEWLPEHLSWADKADLVVIAPCTANVMAKIAHGMADDLLSCTVLATKAPVVIAPAMNVNMWENAVTQQNVKTLKTRGITVVDVGEGELACGVTGKGRMAEVETVLAVVEKLICRRRK